MQQPMMYRIDQEEPGFDLEQAVRAPVPRQVATPIPNDTSSASHRLRLLLAVCGNVLGGGALLAFLLAAPLVIGRLLGQG